MTLPEALSYTKPPQPYTKINKAFSNTAQFNMILFLVLSKAYCSNMPYKILLMLVF